MKFRRERSPEQRVEQDLEDVPGQLGQPGWRFRDWQDAYGAVFLLLLALLVVPAFIEQTDLSRLVLGIVACSACLLALHSSHVRTWVFGLACVASAAVLLGLVRFNLGEGSRAITTVYVGLGLLLLLTPLAILARIVHHQQITARTLLGALSVYLLIGMGFSFVYLGMDVRNNAALTNVTPHQEGAYGYYSFVTMTTLGYGDIVPVSETARTAAILEAITGQVFLVVVVARVVSMLGQETSRASFAVRGSGVEPVSAPEGEEPDPD